MNIRNPVLVRDDQMSEEDTEKAAKIVRDRGWGVKRMSDVVTLGASEHSEVFRMFHVRSVEEAEEICMSDNSPHETAV